MTTDDIEPSLTHLFDTVLARHAGKTVPVGTLVNDLHQRGFAVLLILFSLPLCIPVPKPPPIDSILGIPLFYLCIQMIMGRAVPYLPKKVTERPISADLLVRAFEKGRRVLGWFERIFRPRMLGLSDHRLMRICGFLGLALTISVLLPVPLSNTVPSICMVVMAIAIVCRDAVFAILAGIAGCVWIAALIVLVWQGSQWLAGLV